MAKKKWYKSRTLWGNALAMVVIIALQQWGVEITETETGAGMVLLNCIFRLITGSGLEG